MGADLMFALLDADNQAAANKAAWWVAVLVTAGLIVGVVSRHLRRRRRERAKEGAAVKARLRGAAFKAIPTAADEEWQRMIAAIEGEDRR